MTWDTGSVSPGLHVTLCHLAAPCHRVTVVPQCLAPCHRGSMSPCVTCQLHVPVSPRFHVTWTRHHHLTWALQCLAPCPPGSMSPGLHVIVSPGSSISPCHCGSAMPGSMSPGLRVPVSPGFHVTGCHSVSLWFHNTWLHVTQQLHVTVSPCLHITWPPCHRVTWALQCLAPCHQDSMTWDTGSVSPGSSMSLCCLGSTSPGLHVTWTLHHRVTWQLCVPVSTRFHSAPCHPAAPCLCVTWAPHHPVSPGSSISPCHLGSTIPGSMSPGLHDMGHRLCVTRAL